MRLPRPSTRRTAALRGCVERPRRGRSARKWHVNVAALLEALQAFLCGTVEQFRSPVGSSTAAPDSSDTFGRRVFRYGAPAPCPGADGAVARPRGCCGPARRNALQLREHDGGVAVPSPSRRPTRRSGAPAGSCRPWRGAQCRRASVEPGGVGTCQATWFQSVTTDSVAQLPGHRRPDRASTPSSSVSSARSSARADFPEVSVGRQRDGPGRASPNSMVGPTRPEDGARWARVAVMGSTSHGAVTSR